jgi:hypothetical protein
VGHRARGAAADPAAREDPHRADAADRGGPRPGAPRGQDYIEQIYEQVQSSIQNGMDMLTRRRAFPLFG